ncbi:MAG: elongation factor G [Thermomicrobiales bacterium]
MNQYPAERIRNVGLFSHGSAGKTSLAEAMLFDSGAVNRLGKVEEGTTTSDFDPDEIKRRISISTGVLPIEWNDHKLNILDVPGYDDFAGEMIAAMRVVDGALIVVDASAGVEVGTEKVWHLAERNHVPRILFANKMDRDNADFARTLESLREAFGKRVAPVQFPVGQERDFKGVVDLLAGRALIFHDNADGGFDEVPIPNDLAEACETYRQAVIESIAEHNEDLMMRYLEDEPISDEELLSELHCCIADGSVIPLLCGAATSNRGIQPLLKALVDHLPAASERVEHAHDRETGEEVELRASEDEPLTALAFKTIADPHVGRVTYFRVFSGTLESHSQVTNATRNEDERIGQLFYLRGKDHLNTETVVAGDIGAVSKLAGVQTGDTIGARGSRRVLEELELPSPSYAASLHPESKADLDKLSQALVKLHEEDPTLRISRGEFSGETIISGLGESHVQIAVDRMSRRSGVNVSMSLPRVAYRETIGTKTISEYKHKKQTGGAGQYGHVFLELEPLPEVDFEFSDRVVGGAVPKGYFPAVEKGVREALDSGPVAGFPVVNVRVVLTDGSYHDVDSNEMAFKIAAKEAFRRGMLNAQPSLLEPVVHLRVTVPDASMGDVMGDLNARRAHVNGMEPGENGTTSIDAHVPAAEVQRYATELKSMTQGRGTFSTEFAYYQPVPVHLAEQIKSQVEAARAA